MTSSRCGIMALLLPAMYACYETPTDASSDHSPADLRASPTVGSECGGQTEFADSHATVAFSSRTELGSSSGITADSPQPFVGGMEGVLAKIFYHDEVCSRSGDVVFDPDRTTYKPARKLIVYFPTGNAIGLSSAGLKTAPTLTFSALMQLGSDVAWDPLAAVGRDAKIDTKYPGADRGLEFPAVTADRPGYPSGGIATPKFRINLGITGCETLEYQLTRSSRTAGLGSFAQLVGKRSSFDSAPLGEWAATRDGAWTVESVATGPQGQHLAQCYVTKKGSLVTNGAQMHMPFRVNITENP